MSACPECNNVKRHRDDCRYGALESRLSKTEQDRDRLLRLNLEAKGIMEDMSKEHAEVKAQLAAAQREKEEAEHKFKNFHRLLCERFKYVHDERDWKRDQLSLIEHITALSATPLAPGPPFNTPPVEEPK